MQKNICIIRITNKNGSDFQSCFSTIFYLKCYIESFYLGIISEQNKLLDNIHNTFTVPYEKPFHFIENGKY